MSGPVEPRYRPQRLAALVGRGAGGAARCVGWLDTSLRLAGHVLLVETPPRGLDVGELDTLAARAATAADLAGKEPGWSTVEFLADEVGNLAVAGVGRGLPRGAEALEAVTGLDLPREEERLAAGASPTFLPAAGHALSLAVSALDPDRAFAPSAGEIQVLRLPWGSGLVVHPRRSEGDPAPGGDDAEIVRITARGRDRDAALVALRQGLARTFVRIADGATDKAMLVALLESPELLAGTADSAWLARVAKAGRLTSARGAEAALVAAAVIGYEDRIEEAIRRFFLLAQRGRPEAFVASDNLLALHRRGETYSCRVAKLAPRRYRVEIDGQALVVGFARGRGDSATLFLGSHRFALDLQRTGGSLLVEVDGVPHRWSGDPGSVVRAPMPAIVTAVAVRAGDPIDVGTPLVTLEAMKMETVLAAERSGVVRRVTVRPNTQVGLDDPLLIVDPPGEAPAASDAPRRRLELAALARESREPGATRDNGDALLDALRLVLGYDIDPETLAGELASASRHADVQREEEVLRAYLDVIGLFRPLPTDDFGDDWRHSVEEYLFTYLRDPGSRGAGLPAAFLDKLRRALAHYGVHGLDPSPELDEALFRLALARRRQADHAAPILALLEARLERGPAGGRSASELELIERMIVETRDREPVIHDLAREVRYRCFDRPAQLAERSRIYPDASRHAEVLATSTVAAEHAAAIAALVAFPFPLHAWLSERFQAAPPAGRAAILEVIVRRYYRSRELGEVLPAAPDAPDLVIADYEHAGAPVRLIAGGARLETLDPALVRLAGIAARSDGAGREIVGDLYLWSPQAQEGEIAAEHLAERLAAAPLPEELRRVAISLSAPDQVSYFTFRRGAGGGFVEDRLVRGLHPMIAQRLQLWRLSNFRLDRLPSPKDIHVLHGVALDNEQDERLFVLAEVRDLTLVRDAAGRLVELPQAEHVFFEALAAVRRFQIRRTAEERLQWNRIVIYLWPPLRVEPDELNALVSRLAAQTNGLGLEKVLVHGRTHDAATDSLADWLLEVSNPGDGAPLIRFREPSLEPLKPLRDYAQKVVELRRRGLPYPYEIVRMLVPSTAVAGEFPPGEFVEHDLDDAGRLSPVARPPGGNRANVVVGLVRNVTARYPEGMTRVILLGDASRGMGALAEPECRRILAAIDLAAALGVPLEWFALSAGARIAMDSGTENMDWIARVLRRLVEHTQAGGEVNVIIDGIAVGAQPYWNAEATMLMHTRGILVMTPGAAMVLTGKRALDFSGGVSAEDNLGIGGYQRIMGPNGQAQYFATDLVDACRTLMAHYEHTYVAPGERFPRPAPTTDPRERDVRTAPHGGALPTVGDVFSDLTNPGRKKPFEIRRVMAAVADQDLPTLERWYGMRDAEIGVVWDAFVGGHSVAMIGFESQPIPRLGWVPAYGPALWTGGTLFPQSSRKIARAINAASGNRPLVVLANLSGFDGSPESMRNWQLEYGAEIGRAVVNFRGPIVFVVVSRYHGGAFVVFSGTLNDNMQVAALTGTYASVIGGAPAAAVVFAREVEKRTHRDPRVAELERRLADPRAGEKAGLRRRLDELIEEVRSEKLGDVAVEYDRVHDIARAQRVGSVHEIIPPEQLRPWIVGALERGMARELAAMAAAGGRDGDRS